ncbi:DUF58 domain-containing protein [Cognatiluteimonas weifangensis]|uniref:DUF58 domain-containing protein n=1 Tax=Cognatiluteimonas weifangensis TaxID=2303539 RepID=A0A372DK38_9GAMM|nr:DUF58 domain-containing protein [Luteimonas weifangensis]RFP59961.1 DUF58 domain-containing protein [Luteimonas weifangensis]
MVALPQRAPAGPRQQLRRRFQAWARPRRPEALPVALDRHRIYVLPTRFGLFFALLLGVMGLGALNYNNNPALLLALLLAAAANASLLLAHLQLSGLQVVAIGAEPVAAGTPLELRLHARAAPGRERRGLRVDCGAATTTLSLSEGSGQASLLLPTTQRGWLDPGRLCISSIRPLGLARAWAYVWPQTLLLVYPAPEAHGPPLPPGGGSQAPVRLHPAGDDVHHLRAYRRGDPRRAIAWKPSARRGALLVREYEQPRGADVVLDWRQLSALAWEARIRRLARWVDEAEREGRRYRLQLPGQPALGPASGAQHRHACLRALALLPAAGER